MLTNMSCDPETISLLTEVLDRAAAAISTEQRTQECKVRLASNILGAAASGERDPIRLYAAALSVGPNCPAARPSGSLKRAAEGAGHRDEDARSDKTGDQISDPTAAERDAEEAH